MTLVEEIQDPSEVSAGELDVLGEPGLALELGQRSRRETCPALGQGLDKRLP